MNLILLKQMKKSDFAGFHEKIKHYPGNRVYFFAEQLNTSNKNVERWIKQLKREDLIEFKGAPKTGGYYVKKS